jgi:hypothetical protein
MFIAYPDAHFYAPPVNPDLTGEVMSKLNCKLRPMAFAAGSLALAFTSAAGEAKNWGNWSAPVSIETLPGSSSLLNTPAVDGCPSLSPDGLELYFTSNRTGGQGGVDIWVARRSSTAQGFGAPINLGAPINGPGNESCPTITQGHLLFFTSTRHDPAGDLYVTSRGPKGWGPVDRLGANINSDSVIEEAVALFEDEDGREIIHFNSGGDIYYSVDYGPAQLAAGGVNSSSLDKRPGVSKDGLEIFWDSERFGTLGGSDFWTATRSSTSQAWGTAEHLPALSAPGPGGFFGPGFDARPYLSRDGTMLIFGSVRAGGEGVVDLYVSTRQKLTGDD